MRELGAFDIGQERYLIDRTGIYEAVNLCSLHEDEYKQGMSADASMVPWEDEWMTRAEGYEPCKRLEVYCADYCRLYSRLPVRVRPLGYS